MQALFGGGLVTLRDATGRRVRVRKGERVAPGFVVELAVEEAALDERAVPDHALALDVVLERPELVVVDKPAGVASAPLIAGERGTVANALLARYPEMQAIGFSPREPGLCHRLDTGTSGLLIAARSTASFDRVVTHLRSGAMDKRYLLVCEESAGSELEEHGTIKLPLTAHPTDKRRVVVFEGDEDSAAEGRPAETSYHVLERRGTRALVEACAHRAFRHQIRAHFAALRAPLVGDPLYGGPDEGLGRYALHASHLSFAGDELVAQFSVDSPLPEALARLVR